MNMILKRAGNALLAAAVCWLCSLPGLAASGGDTVIPTNEWINLYSANSTANGQPVQVGAVVAVFDPQGVQCGQFVVSASSKYGLMPCYRDDASTPAVDEGAEPGDTLSFTIDGVAAMPQARSLNSVPVDPDTIVTWTQNLDRWEVDLNAPPQHVYAAPDSATCQGNQPCYFGSEALQDSLNAVADGGLITVLGNHTTSSSLSSGSSGANSVTIEGDGNVAWTGGAGALLAVGPGAVTVKGLTLSCQGDCAGASAFSQSGGALLAYANNITGFGSGYNGSAGTANLRHNWWGAAATGGSVGQDDAFAFRLGAAVAGWSESGALGDSGNGRDAAIAAVDGTGTGVIVSHGRGTAQAPFGKVSGDAAPCSDYYDFFVLGGSTGSTWDVTLPVDDTAGCNANTAGGTPATNKLFLFALTVEGAPDTTCVPGPACWNLYAGTISRDGAAPPFALTAESVSLVMLGSTPAVAGDENGYDPNLITLRRFDAGGSSSWWPALALGLLVLAVLGFARLRSPGGQPTTPGRPAASAPGPISVPSGAALSRGQDAGACYTRQRRMAARPGGVCALRPWVVVDNPGGRISTDRFRLYLELLLSAAAL